MDRIYNPWVEDPTLKATVSLVPSTIRILLNERLVLQDQAVYRRLLLIDHQSINFNGNRTFEQVIKGFAGMMLVIRLARCTTATPNFWPSATNLVTARISTSADGGTTWQEWTAFSGVGGIIPDGNEEISREATESSVVGPIPSNANRIQIVVSTTSILRSELTAEAF